MPDLKEDGGKGTVGGGPGVTCQENKGYDFAEHCLSKERFDALFAETDPHRQFKLFASYLGIPHVENMSRTTKVITDYDYLNVMFCREQNFTAAQTIAFRDTARSVFEAAIVRGELDFNEAYQVFTDCMLSLSGATAPQETAQQHPTPWSTAEGIRPSQESVSTGGDEAQTPPASSTASATKRTLNSSDKVAKQEALTEKSERKSECWPGGIDADAPNVGAESIADPRGRKDGNRSGESPLFSVREIANITDFVARGLFRNFALYRMYFKQPARRSHAVRSVRVETPLVPPPLRGSKQDA